MEPYYTNKLVTIYHGDCLDILPELPKVDLVLTDPPYGVGLKYESIAQYPHSLGLYYSAMTAFLGFRPNEGEYKVMG